MKKVDQVSAQFNVVQALAEHIQTIANELQEKIVEGMPESAMDVLGNRSARLMEDLEDLSGALNGLEVDDEWMTPVFERAHELYPKPALSARVEDSAGDRVPVDRGWIRVARCPNCDGGGGGTTPSGDECQFCYERGQFLAAPAVSALVVSSAPTDDPLRVALRFYANGYHAELPDWEPPDEPNWLCPPSDIEGEEPRTKPWTPNEPPPKRLKVHADLPWMVEDGSIAAMALTGKTIDWQDERPAPIKGEPDYVEPEREESEEARK